MLADIYSQIKEHTTSKFRKCILILALCTVAITVVIANIYQQHLDVLESSQSKEKSEQAVWKESEDKVRATSGLDIKFTHIGTSRSVYRELEQAANDTINYTKSLGDTPIVDSSVEIEDGEQYIVPDTSNNNTSSSKSTSNLKLVSGIYCTNMYVAQYMGESGQFETVISTYSNGNIDSKYRADYKAPNLGFEINLSDDVQKHQRDPLYIISEDDYLSDIGYVLGNLYNGTGRSLEELRPITEIYFTDCIDALDERLGDKGIIESTRVGLIKSGKSSIDSSKIDRIYVQLELEINSQQAYVDLELKLGADQKIYDIDIL